MEYTIKQQRNLENTIMLCARLLEIPDQETADFLALPKKTMQRRVRRFCDRLIDCDAELGTGDAS